MFLLCAPCSGNSRAALLFVIVCGWVSLPLFGYVAYMYAPQVYDMTRWADSHPGGHVTLLNVAGRDGTDNFLAYHPASVWTDKLPYFCVGQLPAHECRLSALVADFRALRERFLKDSTC